MGQSNKYAPLPSFYEEVFPNPWMMSVWEKHTFISLLSILKPEAAIEIGNASGGSLQVLHKMVPEVFALDINEEVHRVLKPQFPEVHFHMGVSWEILPGLLKQLTEKQVKLGFILIDGDHSAEGVKKDIETILNNYKPVCRMVILFHDSFNPECRKGILAVNWKACPYVHLVDVDYVPGTYVDDVQQNKQQPNTMWGGFSLALLEPFARKNELIINQSSLGIFKQAFKGSFYNTLRYRLHELLNKLKRMLP
jgi:hypothetical protein